VTENANPPPTDMLGHWPAVDPFDSSDPYFWVRLEHLGRYLFALDYLRTAGAARVIDAGAGTGFGARLMADGGLDVTAVDIDGDSLSRYVAHDSNISLRSAVADLECDEIGGPGARFDAAILFEVLEHLLDPRTVLTRPADRLTPDGILLCSVPNRIWEGRTETGLPTNLGHKTLFGRQEIISLLEGCDLRVEYILGQGICNYLMRRETALLSEGKYETALGDERAVNSQDRLMGLARLVGYPTADYAEWSYSLIVVASRSTPTAYPNREPHSKHDPATSC
jgi:SAM-dependent methyltransferase